MLLNGRIGNQFLRLNHRSTIIGVFPSAALFLLPLLYYHLIAASCFCFIESIIDPGNNV